MRAKRFLLFASYADSLINFRGALIQAVLDSGVDVHVAAPGLGPKSEAYEKLRNKGVFVHDIAMKRTGLNPFYDFFTFAKIFLLALKIRPDVMLCYTAKPVIYGGIAGWLACIKGRFSLITGLGYAFNQKGSLKFKVINFLVRFLYRLSLTRSSLVFFQNPDDERLFRSMGLLSPSVPSRIVNGSGVDVSEFSTAPLPSRPIFLLIARLLGDKGVREYVNAAKIVNKRYKDARFLLVGWIDDNPDAIKQVELDEWVKEGEIEFLGKLSDVRPAIAEAAVYVLPSYREGTPRTVLEAMAMGRPIITTDAPGCRETVIDGENGRLVPVKNVEALSDAMCQMVLYPDDVARMGARSRVIAEEKYSVKIVNEVMLKDMGIQ